MNVTAVHSWDLHQPARFRLPAFGGAGVFLRSQIRPMGGSDSPRLALDLMLLSPDVHTWYLSRTPGPGFIDRLAAFLFGAAADFHPERSIPTLDDPGMGFALSVVSSTEERVCLDLGIVTDLGAAVAEYDGLNFETSRAALAACAHSVRALDGSSPDVDLDVEI